jgi:uncharacterized tellurite resistance protein B-like protein
MTTEAFESRRIGFEAEYFKTRDAQLVEKLKDVFHRKFGREELRKTTGITNDEILDRLLNLQVKGELLTAFRLYPLVEIAWADGRVDSSEIKAVLDAAEKMGVPAKSESLAALEAWLNRGPTEDGRIAWKAFAGELTKKLTADELSTFRHDLLEGAKAVANASGGLLGFGGNVSPSEKRVIEDMSKQLGTA